MNMSCKALTHKNSGSGHKLCDSGALIYKQKISRLLACCLIAAAFTATTFTPLTGRNGVMAAEPVAKAAPAAKQVIEEDPVWPELKTELFESRAINSENSLLTMEAPYRAHDAALVPIVIKANQFKPGQYIKALTLVVDNNPVPVAAVFDLSPKLGPLHLETRIRINQYSYVRAIAEMNDGSLFMVAKYVKAAGGCSAPAMKDMEARIAAIGRMKLRQFTAKPDVKSDENSTGDMAKSDTAKQLQSTPAQREIQLMVRHPNYSGMQLNQETGYYIPAHYVEKITVNIDGEQLMKVDGAISLSEDPIIRFRFQAATEQPTVKLIVTDTKKQTFETEWKMKSPSELGS